MTTVALLTLNAIWKSFSRGLETTDVLRDVSLEIVPGEMVAVYGQRNAGKSTLLRVAAGFDPPDAGEVRFAGEPLARVSRRRIAAIHRTGIAWVERTGPPNPELTMQLHVALALYRELGPKAAQRHAIDALAEVGAGDFADCLWSELSDATRILVAIAHALVRQPRLLVVDDPTAGLGIVERERVVGLLRTAAEERGIGVLMAAPDMPAMLHAHDVRSLSRGRLIAPVEAVLPTGGDVVQFPTSRRSA